MLVPPSASPSGSRQGCVQAQGAAQGPGKPPGRVAAGWLPTPVAAAVEAPLDES